MRKLGLSLGLAALLSLCFGCGQALPGISGYSPTLLKAQQVEGAYQLFIGPESVEAPVLAAMQNAQKSIDLSVYLLSNERVINTLLAAVKRGITTRVILERNPFNPSNPNEPLQTNLDAAKVLIPGGVRVGWSDPAFRFNHSKYFLVDGNTAYVSTANFTEHGLTANREMVVKVSDPADVKELAKTFEGDWTHQHYQSRDAHLVVSPYNSRTKLMALMGKAKQSLRIEMEVMTDEYAIQDLLAKGKKKGLSIQVLLSEPARCAANADTAKKLMDGGIAVKYLASPASPYLHAKAIQVDGKEIYIGSINLTKNSMDGNREVGLDLNDPAILSAMDSLWQKDWTAGVDPNHYTPSPTASPDPESPNNPT